MDRYKSMRKREIYGKELLKEHLKHGREAKRMELLGEMRNIEATPDAKKEEKKKKSRLELLKEWKLKKQEQENNNKMLKKKPPFYAGRIQKTATGSPKLANITNTSAVKKMTTRSQTKSTRNKYGTISSFKDAGEPEALPQPLSQLNRVKNKALIPVKKHVFALPKAVAALPRLTIPNSPKITKSARKAPKPLQDQPIIHPTQLSSAHHGIPAPLDRMPKKPRMSEMWSDIEPVNAKDSVSAPQRSGSLITPPAEEFSTVQAVAVAKDAGEKSNQMEYSPEDSTRPVTQFEHLAYSPFIEKRRGSKRKSSGQSRKLSLAEKVAREIEKEETVHRSKICSFRLFVSNETSRLLALSENWAKFLTENPNLPTDVEGDINAVVGKTKLLTSDKFKQFQDLIDKCEAGDPLIKVDDLQGFHDWVSLEVEDLDKVFTRLDERRQNNWTDIVEEPLIPAIKKPSKVIKNVAKKPSGTSNMRAHILAARKKLMAQKAEEPLPQSESPAKDSTPELGSLSPRHAECLSTPREPSNLRVRVLKRCSGLDVIAATWRARNSLSPAELPAVPTPSLPKPSISSTPARSILRQTPATAKSSFKKSVAFDGVPPKYLLPSQDTSSEESPDILKLIDDATPVRRSQRILLQKSAEKNKKT